MLLQSGITAEELYDVDSKQEEFLFDIILKKHPMAMQAYLDLMVTSNSKDIHANQQQIIFNLSMFNLGTTPSENHLDKHLALINNGQSQHLNHPVLRFFSDIKWEKHRLVCDLICASAAHLTLFCEHTTDARDSAVMK